MSEPEYQPTKETQALTVTEPQALQQIEAMTPEKQMKMAEKVSKLLKQYLDRKPRQVKFNGARYPEADDWNVVASFFGYTARITATTEIRTAEGEQIVGYIAHADLVRDRDCAVVSAAEAQCSRDERNWEKKPAFQLRSMAQTRACAKAIKNKFAWVMVLSGLQPTPAEEMMDGEKTPDLMQCCNECGEDMTDKDVYAARKKYGKTICAICQKHAKPLDAELQNGQEKVAKDMGVPVSFDKKRGVEQFAHERGQR